MMLMLLLALFCSYQDVLQADLIAHGKVRWSKMDAGDRIVVEIEGGNATRVNPGWSPVPQKLTYDLGRERALERALKAARLPAPDHASPTIVGAPRARNRAARAGWRTLEVLVEDPKKGWRSAGTWSMPVKAWQKGRFASIFEALEPLLDVKPELYDTVGAPKAHDSDE